MKQIIVFCVHFLFYVIDFMKRKNNLLICFLVFEYKTNVKKFFVEMNRMARDLSIIKSFHKINKKEKKKMKEGIKSDDLEVYCFPDESKTNTATYIVAW